MVPADYRETGTVLRVAEQLPGIEVSGNETMDALLMDNLVSDAPADLRTRLAQPLGTNGLRYVDTAAGQTDEQSSGGLDMIPFIIVILIMIPLYSSGGMLLRSLTQEKSNRTMGCCWCRCGPASCSAASWWGWRRDLLHTTSGGPWPWWRCWSSARTGGLLVYGPIWARPRPC